MKKFKIIFFCIVIVALILLFLLYFSTRNSHIEVTTFEKAYSIVSQYEEKEKCYIDIYLDQKDTYFTNKQVIQSAYILDKNEENALKINIVEISKNQEVTLKNKKFYGYRFTIELDVITTSDYQFIVEEAYLKLNFKNVDSSVIKIGSFSYYKVVKFGSSHNHIHISKLKGIINEREKLKSLVGVFLEISKLTSEEVILEKVEILSKGILVANSDVLNMTDQKIESQEDIIKTIGYDYRWNHNQASQLNITLKREKIAYLLPLIYESNRPSSVNYPLNSCGLKITYKINEVAYEYYMDDFIYFQNQYYSQNEINALTYYIYEEN